MRLRKVSIFVDGHLRQRLTEKGNELLASAFGYAVLFPALLVQLLSTGDHEEEDLPNGLQPMYKFFHGLSGESHRISDAFVDAVRIEGVVTTYAQNVVGVEISFYKRAVKTSFYSLRTSFDSEGNVGNVVVSCCV